MAGERMSEAISWTVEAEARLKEIPFFVRPAARKKIEKFAQAAGMTEITVEIYEQAKQKFGEK
jgi:Proto-chlorophyllide reductase 57 kD subunit